MNDNIEVINWLMAIAAKTNKKKNFIFFLWVMLKNDEIK